MKSKGKPDGIRVIRPIFIEIGMICQLGHSVHQSNLLRSLNAPFPLIVKSRDLLFHYFNEHRGGPLKAIVQLSSSSLSSSFPSLSFFCFIQIHFCLPPIKRSTVPNWIQRWWVRTYNNVIDCYQLIIVIRHSTAGVDNKINK